MSVHTYTYRCMSVLASTSCICMVKPMYVWCATMCIYLEVDRYIYGNVYTYVLCVHLVQSCL